MSRERQFSRREIFQGLVKGGAALVLGGCGSQSTPESTPTSASQAPPETTKTPFIETVVFRTPTKPTEEVKPTLPPETEVIVFPQTQITAEFLKQAFVGISGEEEIQPSMFATPALSETGAKMSFIDFVEKYAASGWDKEIAFKNLTPLDTLKVFVSLGTYAGAEGVYYPGGIVGQEILPFLSGLSFLRLRLDKFVLENPGFKVGEGATIPTYTDMAIVGRISEVEEMDLVLVSFTDWLRVEGKLAPRQLWGIIPVSLPADPENKEAFTLQNLLEKEGLSYEGGEISFKDQKGKTVVYELNTLQGEALQTEVREDIGLFFVDQKEGEVLKVFPADCIQTEDIEYCTNTTEYLGVRCLDTPERRTCVEWSLISYCSNPNYPMKIRYREWFYTGQDSVWGAAPIPTSTP